MYIAAYLIRNIVMKLFLCTVLLHIMLRLPLGWVDQSSVELEAVALWFDHCKMRLAHAYCPHKLSICGQSL